MSLCFRCFCQGATNYFDPLTLETAWCADWSTMSSANMPNAFFFRKPFDELDVAEYSLNAMSYTKRPNPTRCLGEMPYTERMLDIRWAHIRLLHSVELPPCIAH